MNVTYLLGAGASVGAIPILSKLPESMDEFCKKISKKELTLQDYFYGYTIAPFKTQQKLIADLCWIVEETNSKRTIDEFAYYLFRNGEIEKLDDLKLALTVFFIWRQLQKPFDKRYRVFLESFLRGSNYSFPNNLKILTWNYDFQIEKTYGTITKNYRLNENLKVLNVSSKYSKIADFDVNHFGVVKLNGTTNIIKIDGTGEYPFINTVESKLDVIVLERILCHYTNGIYSRNEFKPGISFAWEVPEGDNEIVKAAMRATKETEILVVIGYSFPNANLGIDREIIQNMSKLKKIYYQIPEANTKIDEIKRKLRLTDMEVCPESKTENFFIPPEIFD